MEEHMSSRIEICWSNLACDTVALGRTVCKD